MLTENSHPRKRRKEENGKVHEQPAMHDCIMLIILVVCLSCMNRYSSLLYKFCMEFPKSKHILGTKVKYKEVKYIQDLILSFTN